MADFKIQTTINISTERVADLLVSALEGGSNYWYMLEGIDMPDKPVFISQFYEAFPMYCAPLTPKGPCPCNDDECPYDTYSGTPRTPGGALIFSVMDDDEPGYHYLDLTALKLGLQLMATKTPRHFANFMREDDDAETGDVFLQLCLFGEIVFG